MYMLKQRHRVRSQTEVEGTAHMATSAHNIDLTQRGTYRSGNSVGSSKFGSSNGTDVEVLRPPRLLAQACRTWHQTTARGKEFAVFARAM